MVSLSKHILEDIVGQGKAPNNFNQQGKGQARHATSRSLQVRHGTGVGGRREVDAMALILTIFNKLLCINAGVSTDKTATECWNILRGQIDICY